MYRQTVKYIVKTDILEVRPAKGTGITLNNIPVSPAHVVHNLFRVDMAANGYRAYICEHPLASLKICGVHDAEVVGIRKEWDFARPEDRSAYSLGLKPNAVLGPPTGRISGGLVEAIEKVGIKRSGIVKEETTVAKKVEFSNPHGKIIIEPAPVGTGLQIYLKFGQFDPIETVLGVYSGLEPKLRRKVAGAITPFLKGLTEETAYHTLGDLIGDIAGTGGVDNGYVKVEVWGSIHTLTITACKKAGVTRAKEH